MRELFWTIGAVSCALAFAACAVDPAAADPADQETRSTTASLAVAATPSPGADATGDAVAATPGVTGCTWLAFSGGPCDPGFTCMWKNADLGGERVEVPGGCFIPDLRVVRCPSCTSGNFNDQASSWQNISGGQSCWWFNINPPGPHNPPVVMPNGDTHLTMSPGNNDQASAFGSCQ